MTKLPAKGFGKDIDPPSLERFFREAKARGYPFLDYERARTSSRFIILRHDVDVDPYFAAEMAELEARHGATSTYFFMLRNPLYNLISPQASECVRRICELGHQVGLHFDVTAYAPMDEPALLDAIRAELAMLRDIAGAPYVSRCVTFHKPAPQILDREIETEEFFSGYNREFFQDMRYIADSGGNWRYESILDLICGDPPPKIHFNSHPVWWMSRGCTQMEKMTAFLERRFERSQEDLAFTINDPSRDFILYRPPSRAIE